MRAQLVVIGVTAILLLACNLQTLVSMRLATTTPIATVAPTSLANTTPSISQRINGLLDLSFIDPQRGWLLAAACPTEGPSHACPIAVRKTINGGQTWQALSPPQATATFFWWDQTKSTARFLDFATEKDGWAFGAGFFSTHDGGLSWKNEDREVIALSAVGSSVWAIERKNGILTLTMSSDLGKAWNDAIVQPKIDGGEIQLIRTSVNDAWILAPHERYSALFATHDGGRTWRSLSDPTAGSSWAVSILSASKDGTLWLLYGSGPATIMQSKRVYTSNDGGMNWTLMASSPFPPENATPVGELDIDGHMVQIKQFAAVSTNRAFLSLEQITLFRTDDGGHSWIHAVPSSMAADSMRPVVFFDETHGWAGVAGNTLYRTIDGGRTWSEFPVE